MIANRKLIGERVKRARTNASFQRRSFAQLLGVSDYVIYRLETGKSTPNIPLLERVASELKVPVNEFTRPEPIPERKYRIRTRPVAQPAQPTPASVIPKVVVEILRQGKLGYLTEPELALLIRNANDPAFANDMSLLVLESLWRRALSNMQEPEHKQAVDEAFESIRVEMEEEMG